MSAPPGGTAAAVAAAVGVALALRLGLAVPGPEEWDAVDFVEGVERYALDEMRPHFPGYPVLIWLGRLARAATGDAAAGLARLSALLGGLTPALVAVLAARL
ncbi:MAG TPA: hypothetical protein VNM66_03680, partial [Thermodesulfobacteriota bacterium]|nr:hypothetical protein [Thermodesulfobacteriota bacterium]